MQGGSALVERCLACEAVVNKEESQLQPVTCLCSLVFEDARSGQEETPLLECSYEPRYLCGYA